MYQYGKYVKTLISVRKICKKVRENRLKIEWELKSDKSQYGFYVKTFNVDS